MMARILCIARREFLAAVSNRAFLIGLLIVPAMMLVMALVVPKILNSRGPQVRGEVAVVDPTGLFSAALRTTLDPRTLASARERQQREVADRVAPGFGASPPMPLGTGVPDLTLVDRSAGFDLATAKNWLMSADKAALPRMALIVVDAAAVTRPAGAGYGGYQLYVSEGVNDATEGVLHEAIRQALVTARLKASGQNPADVEAMLKVDRPAAMMVSRSGEKRTNRGLNRALPFIMGALLFMAVLMGGQALMTSMVEEKSSRVVEVLLAAVSPLELLWGKLLGQLGVGLVVLAIYIGIGVFTLLQFALFGLLDPLLILYLVLFFLVTYLVFGSLMVAIGAAVNQAAEAQSLMGPIMLLLIAPYILAPVIGRAPDSVLSVTLSFIPPINAFAMLARLASDTPPPMWQVGLSLLLGIVAACGAVWVASKIFRIGLLMHGKAPNLATLIRWVRMA